MSLPHSHTYSLTFMSQNSKYSSWVWQTSIFCLFFLLSVGSIVRLSDYLSVSLFVYLTICLFVYLSVCLFDYLCICLFDYLTICLFVCLFFCSYLSFHTWPRYYAQFCPCWTNDGIDGDRQGNPSKPSGNTINPEWETEKVHTYTECSKTLPQICTASA